MKIGHIFNAVDKKHENDREIASQEFKIKYWKNSKSNYKAPKEHKTDFSKMYYNALVPTRDNNIISQYDKDNIDELVDKLGDNLLLISGDFWGIQKFIFDGVTTSKASKILRSRSAMVQLISYVVVERIKKEFDDSKALLFGAGKFMVVAKNENQEKIEVIQKELDSYFLENFFGQNGFIISTSTTTREKLLNQKDNMKEDLNALGKDNDTKKLNKFDLLNVEDKDILINPFEKAEATDSTSCKFCNKRVESHRVDDETKACKVCFYQIELGKKLAKYQYLSIFDSAKVETKDNIEIIKLGDTHYYASFSKDAESLEGTIFDISSHEYFDYPKWSLNSYVATQKDEIKEFSTLAENSSGLMALKADIDKLGDTFRDLYKEDFKKFNRLSREVDFFFSDYITSLLKGKNIYTVFAGGDDLFIIGKYREIVQVAKDIQKEFFEFSLNKTTISMGLVMFKPTTPINFVSNMADEAEKRAKLERDSIDIFGVSMKFKEFYEIEDDFDEVVKYLEDNRVDTTTFYYRLIELCDMKVNLDRGMSNEEKYKDYKFNPNDAMWKSKLNYIFRRNIDKNNNDTEIFTLLSNLIEKGEKFKPSIFLKIYNNRDKKKEK